jgi:beta-D-xylosidase 4
MDQALTRLYHALFNVGYFDSSPYQNLGWSDVGTPDAQQLAYQAAVEGIVLLKNDGVLPAKHPRNVALIGPYANATVQMQGTYSGIARNIVSPLRAAQNMANWEVTYAGGTAINTTNTTGFTSALSAATQADLVIYLGGLDTTVEKEALDRTTLTWPGNQLDLIEQLAKVSKNLVVVQFGGGQVDDAPLLKNSGVNGIVWAGYPSQDGGPAIMDIITGKVAPAGRLPVTQYPASYVDEVSIYDIELRPNDTYPGRTNRFYTGVPTLPFGYGLSYTTFEFAWRRALNPQYNVQSLIAEHRTADKLSGSSSEVNDATPFANVEIGGG